MAVKFEFFTDAKSLDSLHFTGRNHRLDDSHTDTAIDLPIVGVDGEGYNSPDKDHHYDLIAAAGDDWTEHISDDVELTAERIFDFLLDLPKKHGKSLFFIYGGSYDFNMWVKRLPKDCLLQLAKNGKTRWKHYKIQWIPKREFMLQDKTSWECKVHKRGKNKGKHQHTFKRKIHIYDVIGFFQMSFVKALKDWKTVDQATIEHIESMKLLRGEFSSVPKETILKYCLDECRLLVKLGNDFRAACNRADIRPYHWYGAGALAARLMQTHGIKNFIQEAPEVKRWWAHAYFGGRTEISYQGRLPRGGYQYDINSAYPTVIAELPCLVHGEWKFHTTDIQENYNKHQYGIWRVKWNTHGKLWSPFPWRDEKGRIFYPDRGEGYYHRIEIDAATRLYPDCYFEIFDGWTFTPNCTHKPFSFVYDRAKYRLQLKLDGEAAHKPLKLGLNSLYGKTAQTIGKSPPYQNFFWAGFITASTRARILDAIRMCTGTIYSIATDGIMSSVDIPELPVGVNLGEWEKTKVIEGLLIRPGIYKWLDDTGKWHYGTRGFGLDEAKWEQIEAIWDEGRFLAKWKFNATRFIGLRQALHRGETWREFFGKWVTEERHVSYVPTLGTRWWDSPKGEPFPIFGTMPSFAKLTLECVCKHNKGLSNMYVRLREEDFDDLIRFLIDEEQP
jgi:hypothetical protein